MRDPFSVPFSRTSFLERLLQEHPNVESVDRTRDILFTVQRKNQKDVLRILGLDEYVLGMPVYSTAVEQFGKLNIISNGGNWNGYTSSLKRHAEDMHVGIYIVNEMAGALHRDEYWSYRKKDARGVSYDYSQKA